MAVSISRLSKHRSTGLVTTETGMEFFFLFHKQQNKKFKSNLGIFLGELKQVWIEGNIKKMQNWLDLSVNHPLQVGKS